MNIYQRTTTEVIPPADLSSTEPVPPKEIAAYCDPGDEEVTGGGYEQSFPMAIDDEKPVTGPDGRQGWMFRQYNTTEDPITVTVYAICADN